MEIAVNLAFDSAYAVIDFVQGTLYIVEKNRPVFGEFDIAPLLHKQGGAQLVLDAKNGLREGRLRDVKFFGGACIVLIFCRFQKIFQMLVVQDDSFQFPKVINCYKKSNW